MQCGGMWDDAGLDPNSRAEVAKHARRARGTASEANRSAVEDETDAEHPPLLWRKSIAELGFDPDRIAVCGESEPTGEPTNVGVDRKAREAERHAADDVRRLAPDPGKARQAL